MRYENVTEMIGNTPLLRIDPTVHGLLNVDLYAKLESYNPFGSVKDRIAWSMLADDIDSIRDDGRSIIEFSSGNTAKALAALASMAGVKFKTVTNRMKVPEVKKQLQVLGAEIQELPGRSECLDPTDESDPMAQVYRAMTNEPGRYFHTDQYFNPRNPEAHEFGTGVEILEDLDGQPPDWLITGVGTSGSSAGTAVPLRKHNPQMQLIGLVADRSDFIPGIRNADEVHEVGLFDPADYNAIETVTSNDAIDGMLELIRRCGVLAGPTAGANYFGALRHLRSLDASLDQRRTAVFLVCDRFEGYMSYIEQRRPEIFGAPPRANSLSSVTAAEMRGVEVLAPAAAQAWIADKEALVVDLRGPFAYRALHIEGSINIVDDLFEEMLGAGLPIDRARPVLLACPVGEQSQRFAAMLTRMGHADVRSLAGGVVAWRDDRLALVRS